MPKREGILRGAQMRVTTVFGAFLDPVADKLMVCTALVLLAVSPPEPLSQKDLAIPAVIMIGAGRCRLAAWPRYSN